MPNEANKCSKRGLEKKMSVPVDKILFLSVVLVASTLTGSTNNYYNGKILTTILMDNIPA